MKLYIDTTRRDKILVSLIEGGKKIKEVKSKGQVSSETALTLIESALNDMGFALSQIKEIEFEKGPGSYTGTRVGASIANALSLSLLIPVNGKQFTIESPNY